MCKIATADSSLILYRVGALIEVFWVWDVWCKICRVMVVEASATSVSASRRRDEIETLLNVALWQSSVLGL